MVKGRRRSAPLPWRRPFTLASPAARSTPVRLLEAHGVIRGVAPIASAALDAAVLLQLTDVPSILARAGHDVPSIGRHGVERLIREDAIRPNT